MSEYAPTPAKAQKAERERRQDEQAAQAAIDSARIEEQTAATSQHIREIDDAADAMLEDIDAVLEESDSAPYSPSIGTTALYGIRPAA